MLEDDPKRVGIFDIKADPESIGKWRITNTVTTFEHRTYGTWEEVEEQAKVQSEAWEKRLKDSKGKFQTKGKFQQGGPIKKPETG